MTSKVPTLCPFANGMGLAEKPSRKLPTSPKKGDPRFRLWAYEEHGHSWIRLSNLLPPVYGLRFG